MPGRTVRLESLECAAKALESYIDNVSVCVNNLRKNADDCLDNMENDDFSMRAVLELSESLNEINIALKRAMELRASILKKIREIASVYEKWRY